MMGDIPHAVILNEVKNLWVCITPRFFVAYGSSE